MPFDPCTTLLPQVFGPIYSNSRASDLVLLLLCFIEILVFNANGLDPDQTPQDAVSELGPFWGSSDCGLNTLYMGLGSCPQVGGGLEKKCLSTY